MKNEVELVYKKDSILGESPIWDEKNQILYWVDILKPALYSLDPITKKHDYHFFREYFAAVSAVAPLSEESVIIAADRKIVEFNLYTKEIKQLIEVDSEDYNNRFNDGKCDPKGRFIIGSMSTISKASAGTLYCYDEKSTPNLKTLRQNVTISNGITWSPDYTTMYYIDSKKFNILAFDYDLETGSLSNERIVVTLPENTDYELDGMTSDEEGMLWTALWNGGQVVRWDPTTGEAIERYDVPAPLVTSVIFGGKDLSELYITTATVDLTDQQAKEFPLSGSIFRIKTNTKGIPTFWYKK